VEPKSGEKAIKDDYSLRTGSVSYHYPFPPIVTLLNWRIMETGSKEKGRNNAHTYR
jgi:hypothetical protein